MEATKTATGALEVENVDTKVKYWSKLGGQGYLDTPTDLQKVADAIKSA
jgi:hypothetical protein